MAYQYSQVYIAKSPSVNNSLITSPPFFIADFTQVSVSVSTQSTHATNVQVSNADGLQSAIPENSWANVLTPSVNSLFIITAGPRWSRVSNPSLSSATIIFHGSSF